MTCMVSKTANVTVLPSALIKLCLISADCFSSSLSSYTENYGLPTLDTFNPNAVFPNPVLEDAQTVHVFAPYQELGLSWDLRGPGWETLP